MSLCKSTFSTDFVMSFDYPQQQPRRRKGGFGGIMMMLVIGAALYFFMSGMGGGKASDPNSVPQGADRNDQSRVERNRDERISRELQEADEERRQREAVFGSAKQTDTDRGKAMPSGRAARGGDWAIEDVGQKKDAASPTAPTAKKTQGNDGWAIEEVPTKDSSKTGVDLRLNKSGGDEVKLTEKSDWSVEDVKPKNKKTTEGGWTVEEVGGGGK